jgi:hypothetical protein
MTVYPSTPYLLGTIGAEAARLLTHEPRFIRRRREKVSLLDETTTRRQMSVDFELPSSCRPLLNWQGERIYYAPLLFLQKGSDENFDPGARLGEPEPHFANFDFRDQAGRALSVPPRTWNAAVSAAMLQRVFLDAARRQGLWVDPSALAGIDSLLGEICRSEQLRAVGLLHEVRDTSPRSPEEGLIHALDRRDSTFHRLLDACAIASVVMVPLHGSAARAGILKLSYDEQLADLRGRRLRGMLSGLGWFGLSFWWELPYIGAETYHFEIEAPAGLEIYDAGLVQVSGRPLRARRPPDPRPTMARVSGAATRVHLYAPGAARTAEALAWVRLRVRRHEFIGAAATATLLVAVVLWIAYASRHAVKDTPNAAPALLLLFPSAVAGYAARPDPHRLTARMLRLARRLLTVSAALPFAAAGTLAAAERDSHGRVVSLSFATWWLVFAVVATVIAVLLLAARLLPLPRVTAERLADTLGLDIGRAPRNHPEPLLDKWRRSARRSQLVARRRQLAARVSAWRSRRLRRYGLRRRRRAQSSANGSGSGGPSGGNSGSA